MKKLFLVLTCSFLLAACGNVKLSNGENALVTFNDDVEGISSDDLYKKLKEKEGITTLVNLIDAKLLNKLYETTSEEKDFINSSIKTAKKSAQDMNISLDLYLSYYYGAASESDYKDQLSLIFKRNAWADDYAKESVTDTQINDYYKNYYVGDIEAKHILITVDAKSDASNDEKTEAENTAFDKAAELIEKLNNGESFDDLVKQYSMDTATSKKGGSLGKINVGDYDEFNRNYFFEFNILYKVSKDEKSELNDEIKDKIREVVGKELKEDSNFIGKALIELRKKYNMDITDSELKKLYEKDYSY